MLSTSRSLIFACLGTGILHANMLIGNYSSSSIEKFSDTGTDLGVFVPSGSGGLVNPGGFAFGADGNLYVASRGTDRILEYSGTTGAFIGTFGPTFSAIRDVKFNAGIPYVAQYTNNALRLDPVTGAIVTTFVYPNNNVASYGLTFRASNGDLLVPDVNTGNVLEYNGSGTFLGNFATGMGTPIGLATGLDSRIYGADQGGGTIQVAPSGGGPSVTFASGFNNAPQYLAFAGDGSLFATDYYAQAIDHLSTTGALLSSTPISFSPFGIALFPAATAVPEPSCAILLLAAVILLLVKSGSALTTTCLQIGSAITSARSPTP